MYWLTVVGTNKRLKSRSPPSRVWAFYTVPPRSAWCHLFFSSLPPEWLQNISAITVCITHHSNQTTDWLSMRILKALTFAVSWHHFSMAKTEALINLCTFLRLPFHMWSEYLANPKSSLNFNELIHLFNMDLNSTLLSTDMSFNLSKPVSSFRKWE